MSKMHYSILVINFQKSPSNGGSPHLAPSFPRFWWSKVAWFGQIVVF